MHSLETVLALPQHAMYLALGDYLAARVDTVGVGGLTPIERTLWLVREFDWAVREGGLLGYVMLGSAHDPRATQSALTTLGAADTARALGDAIAAYENQAIGSYDEPVLDEFGDLPVLVCEHAVINRQVLLSGDARQ